MYSSFTFVSSCCLKFVPEGCPYGTLACQLVNKTDKDKGHMSHVPMATFACEFNINKQIHIKLNKWPGEASWDKLWMKNISR